MENFQRTEDTIEFVISNFESPNFRKADPQF